MNAKANMLKGKRAVVQAVTLVSIGAAAIACGSSGGYSGGPPDPFGGSGGGSGSGSGGGSGGGTGSGSGSGSGGGTGSGSGGTGSGSGGTGSSSGTAPPPACGGAASDAPAQNLDFSNNLVASPSPPGNLTAANAPMIVVFGWDDIESAAATAFLDTIFGGGKNPDGSPQTCTVNPNSCYGEGWNQTAKYACGDGTLSTAQTSVTNSGAYELGNHTWDHLENYQQAAASGWAGPGAWPGIPAQYKDMTNGGWDFGSDGLGPGVSIDQPTWQSVISANDAELKLLYGTASSKIVGFRAPRLEINDNGLNAIKAVGYEYDQDLEETLPDGYVQAAVAADTTGAKQGLNWFAWPYTLDNGSPGVWNQQAGGDESYVKNYPTGLWEVPVYEVYVPTADGKTIANQMIAADKDCILPTTMMPPGPNDDCYLSPGEVPAGSSITEVTGFDFNVFIYSRMTADQWLSTMKHTFLLHYYGDRAPFTYGAHPVEYTSPYDSYTLETQANNYGYRDVIKYSTYDKRQAALTQFIQWIQQDPVFSKDTYFLSAGQLVQYMQKPFDKTGAAVQPDTVASPDSNGLFTRLKWEGDGASISVTSGNSAKITFNAANTDDAVSVSAGVAAGALKDVSHIDIKYTSDVPFRIRLLTSDGSVSTTVLLGGVGGDRLARIRVKDFFPTPDATMAQVNAAKTVDSSYMSKVNGIVFESAQNQVTGAKTFNTTIEQITLHGVATSALCSP
ncbi:MAG TPA: hypothetical protein VGI39_29875 [Polyangiaceae bacterium]|jgi:peptidoglycan/xylan/chitin deacetylase (PgdA/CDA1 family)